VLEKLTQKAARYDRSTAKGRLKAEAIDALASEVGALDVWTRVPPSGRRPKLTREQLAAAAVRLADAEGIDALSMRRLAAELDVGTMSLYHYVRTKDELLTLVTDAVMGEVVVPAHTPLPADWRKALTVIARRSHAAFRRHPWMLDINDDPPIGPNSVRHFDQTLEAVSSLDVPLSERLDIAVLIDEYVFGHSLLERNQRKGDDTDDEESMIEYISVLIETGAYPQLEELTAQASLRDVWREVHRAMRDERRFERNLERILDGIEASIPSA
jgi:AcrR family transcriptional regulator